MKTRKTAKAKNHYLGRIEAHLAGTQYCDAQLRPGEEFSLEREPDNTHDSNAIRVENPDFHKTGYLPRRVVSWLAPLVDAGEVLVTGRAVKASREHRAARLPLELDLYLTKKGAHILEERANPGSAGEALHQVVLAAYRQSEAWDRPQAITGLSEHLLALSQRDLLHGTRLLLALLPSRAGEAAERSRESATRGIRDAFARVEVGEALHYRNLTVFPLFVVNGHEPGYCLLSEAIEAGTAELTEVSDSGSVPELLLDNRGGLPILLPEGEVVTGAKQNRVLNITVLVAANARTVLPVSCVERGRWSHISRGFDATHYAPPNLRASKSASVRVNRRRTGRAQSNQGEVWERVAETLRASHSESVTESLIDGYAASRDRVQDYMARLELPERAAGVIVATAGGVAGMDLYDCPDTFRKLWPRIGEAYFFEAGLRGGEGEPAPAEQARDFLVRFIESLEPGAAPVGLGTEYTSGREDVVGSALWHDDRILHSCAFPVAASGMPPDVIY